MVPRKIHHHLGVWIEDSEVGAIPSCLISRAVGVIKPIVPPIPSSPMKLDGLTHWPGFIGCCNPLFMKLHGLQWLGFVLLRFESNKKLKIRVLNQIKMLSRLNVPDLYMYYIIEPDLHFFLCLPGQERGCIRYLAQDPLN